MTMANRVNRQWRLATRPDREAGAGEDHFRLAQAPVPEIVDGEILVRTIYLSLDPTQRLWMSDMDQYMEPVAVGDVMRGGTIGVVEESLADGLAPGDIVQGFWGWQDYAAVEAATLRAKLMKSFSCSPLIFLVCRTTAAKPQPKVMDTGW